MNFVTPESKRKTTKTEAPRVCAKEHRKTGTEIKKKKIRKPNPNCGVDTTQ